MNIQLVRLTYEYREQLFEMLTEWKGDIMENQTDMSPRAIWTNDFHDFENYVEKLEVREETENGWVPDTTLFCLDQDRNIFVGAVNKNRRSYRRWSQTRREKKRVRDGNACHGIERV